MGGGGACTCEAAPIEERDKRGTDGQKEGGTDRRTEADFCGCGASRVVRVEGMDAPTPVSASKRLVNGETLFVVSGYGGVIIYIALSVATAPWAGGEPLLAVSDYAHYI